MGSGDIQKHCPVCGGTKTFAPPMAMLGVLDVKNILSGRCSAPTKREQMAWRGDAGLVSANTTVNTCVSMWQITGRNTTATSGSGDKRR